MRFSTYRRVVSLGWAIAVVLIAAMVDVLTGSLGIAVLFAVVMAFLGAVGAWVTFSLVSARLDDYGGRFPMPLGGLGYWGFDVVDDDDPDADEGDSDVTDREGPPVDAYGKPLASANLCAYCHAPLSRPDAKFCDECGKPVAPPAPPGADGATAS